MSMPTTSEVRDIAEQVAQATVKEFFLALGVNADDPDAVIAVQKDFAHLRAWREASDTVKRKGLGAAVTIIVTGLLGLVWLALSRH
jgi:hypothetical protein